jgi:hypothetical protein
LRRLGERRRRALDRLVGFTLQAPTIVARSERNSSTWTVLA